MLQRAGFFMTTLLGHCPQVQMSGFLRANAKGPQWQTAFNKISRKSVDFIVCDRELRIISAIELQDKTHENYERQKGDEFKRAALKAAGINLIECHAENMPSEEDIRNAFFPT